MPNTAATLMASSIFTHTPSFSPLSYRSKRAPLSISSSSVVSIPKNANFQHIRWISQLGLGPFSPWIGLKSMGISISQHSVKLEKKGKCKGKGVFASLFGVGAPEALVIGVVALLVFGPKGLAEVARNLGKTLRAFQPTIRELQEVSKEFKSTLEREIGLDDMDGSLQNKSGSKIDPNGSPPKSVGVTEEQLRGTLAQLAKETGLADTQSQSKNQSRASDTDTPQEADVTNATEKPESDTLQEPSLAEPQPEKPEISSLQEDSSPVPPPQNPESSSPQEVAPTIPPPVEPENRALQEAGSAVSPSQKPETEA